jgi:type II secretory pathway pseudopilin PulG
MTLVEVIPALAVLAVLLTGLFATLAAAQRTEVTTRENQAATAAVYQRLDVVASHGSFSDTLTTWNGAAFHVPCRDLSLLPASAPLNAGADARKAGRIEVIEVDADGDGAPDDYDGDGSPDLIEIHVVAAWRSVDGSNHRVEAVVRRSR